MNKKPNVTSIEHNKPMSETICLFSVDVSKTQQGQIGVGVTNSGLKLVEFAVQNNKVESLIEEINSMMTDSIKRVAFSIENKTTMQMDN